MMVWGWGKEGKTRSNSVAVSGYLFFSVGADGLCSHREEASFGRSMVAPPPQGIHPLARLNCFRWYLPSISQTIRCVYSFFVLLLA